MLGDGTSARGAHPAVRRVTRETNICGCRDRDRCKTVMIIIRANRHGLEGNNWGLAGPETNHEPPKVRHGCTIVTTPTFAWYSQLTFVRGSGHSQKRKRREDDTSRLKPVRTRTISWRDAEKPSPSSLLQNKDGCWCLRSNRTLSVALLSQIRPTAVSRHPATKTETKYPQDSS